uniref:Magnesium-transporting ATPase, P-type 1 n=1 Tax=Elaeis guineensis var. tenera TaxID=51953 RepID=A0A6I9SN50_ELAGV|nr:uncharacterized protein LOC105060561 isoform X2 [Elaeis guineensis]
MDTRNSINENLVNKGHHIYRISEKRRRLIAFITGCFRKFIPAKSREGGTRSEAEEKVYSWIYTLAQAHKDLVFEYVRSTERGLSFKEAERRLKEGGRNIPLNHTFPSWWQLWWNAFLHPFNIILVVMAILSYLASDNANGSIMLVLVLISVGLRFHQEYNSSRAAMHLSELLKSPVRVQRCAGRVIQTELVVQIDQRDIVPGDIVYFSPGDLFPGDVRLLTAKELVVRDILCIDKTGTLTMDRVIVIHHLDSWGFPNEKVLKFAFLNSYFKTELKGPIDDAILAYVYTNGYRFQSSKWRKIDEVPFDFVRRRMSVIVETDLNSTLDDTYPGIEAASCVISKGALEEVLNICTSIEQIDTGVTAALTPEDRSRVLRISEELSNDGLRVLGVATRKMRTKNISMSNHTTIESNMVFLGLISFFDPPKDSAKQALWQLAERGVKAKVLTGDSLSLAIKVCKEVGIRTTHVITGPDLEVLDHDEFHETIKRVTVLARLTPVQKLRVVQSLQKVGNHVVGFLGDGINDSLALDAADVGISVDSAASVAKNLADIILLEKDLNVLVSGVERGRLTYGNTMKYIKMSLVANISSVISLLIATLFLQFEPLTPKQLLTQNFLYNIGQIAIPWDRMEEGYVKTPQRWSSKELPIFMLWNGPVCSIFDIATFLFLRFYYGAYRLSASNFFHTAWFVEGLLMQALIIHMVRTEKIPFIQDMASWPVIFSTITVTAVGIIIPFTPVGKVMGLTYLPLSYFGFLVVLFLGYFTLGQVVKRAYILTNRQWL